MYAAVEHGNVIGSKEARQQSSRNLGGGGGLLVPEV